MVDEEVLFDSQLAAAFAGRQERRWCEVESTVTSSSAHQTEHLNHCTSRASPGCPLCVSILLALLDFQYTQKPTQAYSEWSDLPMDHSFCCLREGRLHRTYTRNRNS